MAKKTTKQAGSKTEVASATLRSIRMSPRKARLVIDLIRGKQVEPALAILKFSPKKGAKIAYKLLQSAIANAREQARADVDRLWITKGWVDEARTLKRYMPAAHGRALPIRKRASHITIVLGEK
jgi:large subunit ribosomal protein L22